MNIILSCNLQFTERQFILLLDKELKMNTDRMVEPATEQVFS